MDRDTMGFYDGDPEGYARSTLGCDVTSIRRRFTGMLRPGSRVLDLGCGSGRDTAALREEGFDVVPVDGSEGMCRVASSFTGSEVRHLDIMDLDYVSEFDGVWACASLLHLRPEQLDGAMGLIRRSLRDGGMLFLSFKSGCFRGVRDGRWYTDLTSEDVASLAGRTGFEVADIWGSTDPRGTQWVNAVLRRLRGRASCSRESRRKLVISV